MQQQGANAEFTGFQLLAKEIADSMMNEKTGMVDQSKLKSLYPLEAPPEGLKKSRRHFELKKFLKMHPVYSKGFEYFWADLTADVMSLNQAEFKEAVMQYMADFPEANMEKKAKEVMSVDQKIKKKKAAARARKHQNT